MHLKRDTYEFPYLLVRDWTPNNAYENQAIYRLEYGLPHWLLVSDICFVIQSLSLYQIKVPLKDSYNFQCEMHSERTWDKRNDAMNYKYYSNLETQY
jgi:hypothetical protein